MTYGYLPCMTMGSQILEPLTNISLHSNIIYVSVQDIVI